MSEKERLLEKSIPEKSVRSDSSNKNYTNPRTYGVYEILKTNYSKKYRFGNHPVRENELIRKFGNNVKGIGLFLDREDAKKLTSYLNS
ncbi:MAG: hypothetical protein M3405_05955 [Acidobacteriota bacterium]|jgi:hypothetical protein|nr:hypothetical protein [Acidobacteriota bacterium]